MAPLAPARFSTTTDCPSVAPSLSATERATMSPVPPAAYATITWIVRVGYVWLQPCPPLLTTNPAVARPRASVRIHRIQNPPNFCRRIASRGFVIRCVSLNLSQCEDHQLQLRLGSFRNFTLLSLVFFVFR